MKLWFNSSYIHITAYQTCGLEMMGNFALVCETMLPQQHCSAERLQSKHKDLSPIYLLSSSFTAN